MNRSTFVTLLVSGILLAAPQAAEAQGGTLTWAGTVSDQTFTVGAAVSVTLPGATGTETCGNFVLYTLSPTPPAGLSFAGGSNSSRVLSGTPTNATAQTQYTYTAYDQSCYITLTQTFDITVSAAPDIQLSNAVVALAEGGGSTNYTVRLKDAPTGNVTVTVASADNGAVAASPSSLTFTTGNYSTAQTVALTAPQDADGADESVAVSHTASGGGLDGKVSILTANVTDDDKGIVLSTTSLTLTKGQAGRSYTVALAASPRGNVTVAIDKHQGSAVVTPSPNSLTFTNTNWNTPQSVTASPSSTTDGFNRTATLRHRASGGGYGANTPAAALAVLVDDPGNPGLNVSPTSLSLTEGGANGTFTVKLGHTPSHSVSLTVTSSDSGAATVSPSSFTIHAQDWDTGQAVTVTPASDTDGNNESVTIAVAAKNGGYDGETGAVTVTIADSSGISLTPGSVTHDSATLTIAGHTAAWRYKYTSPTGGQCSSEIASGTSTANVTGLIPATEYTFAAYSDSTCQTALTTTPEFTTAPGKVTGVTAAPGASESIDVSWTAATGAASYKVQYKSGTQDWSASRQATATTTSHNLDNTHFTANTAYSFRVAATNATGDGPWSDEVVATPVTIALQASGVEATTATLTIHNYDGNWRYKYTSPTGGACSSTTVIGPTATLTTLTPGTTYTFVAYSDSACQTALATAPDFLTRPGKTGGVAATAAAASL